MKKLLSIVLCIVMVFSLSVTAFADNTTYTSGTGAKTDVSYTGTQTEAYSVSVPASLAPGGSGNVSVSGTWADNRVVKVSADTSVTLTNSILNTDQKTLPVTFGGINKKGDNTKVITASDDGCTVVVSVANISNALFGTWEGTFNYTVSIANAESEEEPLVPPVSGAYFGDTFLTWDELKESSNGETYGYTADAISDTSIGEGAFFECTDLTSIILPNSIENIEDEVFYYCDGLTSVTLSASLESIDSSVFYGCFALTSIVVADGNTVYDSRENCNAIIETATNTLIMGCQTTVIPSSVKSIGGYAFNYCYDLTSITIPEGVTSIGERAFYGCDDLTSLVIPEGVTSIGECAFGSCKGLTSIVVADGNTVYDSRENCNAIIETATNTLIAGCKKTVIPSSVKSIGEYAFDFCTSLTSITIPEGVTSIGRSAFKECTRLTSLVIPEGVTSIGQNAFGACTSLTSLTLPASLESIGKQTFSTCRCLTSITIPEGVTSIGERAFEDCSGLTTLILPDSIENIGKYAFLKCKALTSVTYDGETYTSKSALESALISNSVTVEADVFNNTGLSD